WAQRAQFQQRAVGAQPPVRTFCQIFWTQGRREDRVRAAPAVSCAILIPGLDAISVRAANQFVEP
ncbi:hypothetical protein, partial [Bradyrhizobium sp. 157]|uniref:hypothetical protein n=1 Tax=Bradyrhizobium sp. 157 TaxID=2782631 RepID=UPI001FF77AEA